MPRVRVPIVYGPHGLVHAVPTGRLVDGGILPADGVISDGHSWLLGFTPSQLAAANPTVLVDVPEEDCTNGQLDPVKIKARYPAHYLVLGGRFG